MRGELRSSLILAVAAMGAPALASCADVFGLDEPTVREGAGGATTTGTTTSTSSTSGPGAGGDATSSSSGDGGSTSTGGAGGAGGCDAPADCDDENPCTDDACIEARCSNTPIPDGPLQEDPEDCRTITCVGGEVSDVANDAEDPGDVNPPCETTICEGGAPSPVFAAQGTSCGPDPQECDGSGLCIGCDPAPPDDECGAAGFCAVPTCVDPGVCDPGYLPMSTLLPDPLDGDCQEPQCTGESAASVSIADDTDLPTDLVCGDRGCSGGAPTTTTLVAGQPCFGQSGVCDGLGTASANCRVCRNTTDGLLDQGCTPDTPNCDGPQNGGFGNVCRECIADAHCLFSEVGTDCLASFVCGCNGGGDCIFSPNGDYCHTGLGVCGCMGSADCTEAERGDECMPDGLCGCDSPADCDPTGWGSVCLPSGACGCTADDECASNNCNETTQRCE